MKNEVRGFIFLVLSIVCFCTHQICDKLWWIAAYMDAVRPTTGSIMYGGIVLIALSIIFFIAAILFFIKAVKEKQ
ncbi:hypothetical protein [Mediterraneibacter agrestimuris]|uniref:hypothetical protein n=1 Tax=Mediterraneibacter agrestimuris TaxID=2941333 RepID=UPI00204098AF|nr:hypothetical protein [Mediterraneibacter agrestimuris]